MDNYLKFLNEHKLFSGLTDNQINTLLNLGKFNNYQEGDHIVEEGEAAKDIYIIIHGTVEVLKKEEESQNLYRLAVLTQGDSIGEMSLIEDMPRGATISTLEPTIILSLPILELRELSLSESPDTQLIYFKIVERIAHELCIRLRSSNESLAKSLRSDEVEHDSTLAQANMFAGLWH